MDKLISYSIEHFEEEENLMRSFDYPLYEEHVAKHNFFRHQLDTMLEELDQPVGIDYQDYQQRLGKWLVHWFKD